MSARNVFQDFYSGTAGFWGTLLIEFCKGNGWYLSLFTFPVLLYMCWQFMEHFEKNIMPSFSFTFNPLVMVMYLLEAKILYI